MRIAVIPGTFDPVTLGHVDIVTRAAALFDEVIVGIARNASKTPLLDAETRRAAFARAVEHLPQVRVEIVPGLLVDFCRDLGAVAIVKGLRGGGDLDAEAPMAAMNRHLSGIDTVFLVSDGRLAHIAELDGARHRALRRSDRRPRPVRRRGPRPGRLPGARDHTIHPTDPQGELVTEPISSEDPAAGLLALLDDLRSVIEQARAMPMSASVLVNKAEVVDLLAAAREAVPDQVAAADRIVAEAEGVLARSTKEGAEIVAKAHAEAERLVSDHEITRLARERGAEIVAAAEDKAAKLEADADDYCDSRLAQFEVDLEAVTKQVAAGRARLAARRGAQ
ncbi:pantetheine-phosphate adenylyltransferase [Salana multivorans]